MHSIGIQLVRLIENKQPPLGPGPADGPLLDAWFKLNYRLHEEAADAHVNKSFIEQWLTRLWTILSPRPECFWLFLARINELALLCASRYVDCCEFSAADGLLVEPSCVLLNAENGRTSVSQDIGVRGGPLLPSLYDLLKGSGYMAEDYLLSVSRRTEHIAQVLRMLLALGLSNAEDQTAVHFFMYVSPLVKRYFPSIYLLSILS